MSLYAESSAVLSWLLGETRGAEVRASLEASEVVISSDLTLVECDRVLIRAVELGELTEGSATKRRLALNRATSGWHLVHLAPEIIERARRPFPVEAIRTLDAIHLATLLFGRGAVADLSLLSLYARIRASATEIGIGVQP
jgi:predicted nucleic acid-binding protein